MKASLLAVLLLAAAADAAAPAAKKKAKESAPPAPPPPVYAASTAPITMALVAERFKAFDAALVTLTAEVRQFVRLEGSDTVQSVEGTVSFKKPDLLRLVHRVPEPQTVVSDGTWLWVHRRSTKQVIQSRLDAWRKSEPLAQGLLDFGKSADLLERYDAALSTVTAPGADGFRRFELTLKPKDKKGGDADFELTLKASEKDYFPAEAVLRVGRARIRSLFENARFNPELPADEFRFSPPQDADVFQNH
ncbi:MAG: outer-membrane lipoprotein carrier protein LolA [Elusimicrobiota bacterium]|nr:outer-membrane lipoprotein carrier protein LolA [Elusimicrobiota bacterium]